MSRRTSVFSLQDLRTPIEAGFERILPEEDLNQSEDEDERPEQPQSLGVNTIWSKAKTISPSLILWIFTVIFLILYSVYVYQALLSSSPQVGNLFLSASSTNVFVSILSQVFAGLVEVLFMTALDSLRWQLAFSSSGVSMSTFFKLSIATGWLSVLLLTMSDPIHPFWWFIRLVLPLVGLFFGSILKFQATFEYYFHQTYPEISVFSGWMPLDKRVLDYIHPSRICMYFMTWTPTLLSVSKYAISMPTSDCTGSCKQIYLPGGLETARVVSPFLNLTLLNGGAFGNSDTILINNAPGLLLKFDQPYADFDFDRDSECNLYGPKPNDSIQICIKSVNHSLAVGWAACPTPQLDAETCITDLSWTREPMKTKIVMTAYKQYATTAYKREDLSILNVYSTSESRIQSLNVSDYTAMWSKILVPEGSTHQIDINTPLVHLQNFLAIPLQFMVTCVQFANYSVKDSFRGLFVLPDDMQTTAAGGESTQRFAGKTWTVLAFVIIAVLFMATVGGMFLWMLLQRDPLPNSTGVPEVDIVTRIGEGDESRRLVTLREFVRDENLDNCSSRQLAKSLRQRKVKAVREERSLSRVSLLVEGVVR